MFELSRPKIKIADLSHRVVLCTMHDVVEKDGTMALARAPVMWIWAQIDPSLNAPSIMTAANYSYKGNQYSQGSHRIIIRSESRVEVTSAAWVYEERRITSPRWYKIIGWTESDHWLLMSSQLKERSEDVLPPVGILRSQPSVVEL